MDNSILIIKEYGHIVVTLREIMDSRGISRNRLARLINARYEVINKWYNGEVERIDADILARLCYVLDCKVEDILQYKRREPREESDSKQ